MKHRIERIVCIGPALGYDVEKIGAGCLVWRSNQSVLQTNWAHRSTPI